VADVTLEVRNPSGLHARPAALFVKAAAAFRSEVRLTNLSRDAERSASAKSLLGVLGLGVSCGHRLRVEAEGVDAAEAIDSLARLVADGLGETPVP
jgi:phosphotransferase system HPr (HPr) family protein